jgi:hypothetical protein
MSLHFYEYLRRSHVGKNPKCDEDRTNKYCERDGYLMVIDSWQIARSAFDFSHLKPLSLLGEWIEFLSDIHLKLFELQQHPRALQLFGPGSILCNNINIELFKHERGKVVRMTIQDLEKSKYSFVIELLQCSTLYYIHPTDPIIAFASIVDKNNTYPHEIPLIPSLTPYVYLTLVCSGVQGGGRVAMQQLATLCNALRIRFILLAALSNVIWYYYNQYSARLINRQGQLVNVQPYETSQPIPFPS